MPNFMNATAAMIDGEIGEEPGFSCFCQANEYLVIFVGDQLFVESANAFKGSTADYLELARRGSETEDIVYYIIDSIDHAKEERVCKTSMCFIHVDAGCDAEQGWVLSECV